MDRFITFDKNVAKEILDAFDKTVNSKNVIVEKSNPKQEVLTIDGDNVEYDKFAGIKKGSEIFIKSDLGSLLTSLANRS
jgi:hypothetical protein